MEPRVADIRHLAIVRLSALGDVTLLLPVIETLKQAAPQAQITWITGTAAHRLLEGIPGVEFIVFDKSRGLRAPIPICVNGFGDGNSMRCWRCRQAGARTSSIR